MKTLLISLILLLFMGCTSCPVCPSQDIMIGIKSGNRIMFVPVPKGTFENPDNYMTEDQWKQFQEDAREEAKEREKEKMKGNPV